MKNLSSAFCILVFIGPVSAFCEQPCNRIYGVTELIEKSRSLKGKSICVLGEMKIDRSQDGSMKISPEIEASPRSGVPRGGTARIGFLDWGRSDGAFGNQYKPESFELLEVSPASAGVGLDSGYVIEVQVRGVLEVDKQLQKRIAELLPSDYPLKASDLRPNRYELLVLEVLKARVLGKKP